MFEELQNYKKWCRKYDLAPQDYRSLALFVISENDNLIEQVNDAELTDNEKNAIFNA